jgi:predicted ATPase
MDLVSENKYAPFVFITPPWDEIYIKDEIRREDFKEAVEIHEQIIKAYLKFDYKIISLPLLNPDERVKFILNFLGI